MKLKICEARGRGKINKAKLYLLIKLMLLDFINADFQIYMILKKEIFTKYVAYNALWGDKSI